MVGYNPDMQVTLIARYLGDVDQKRVGMIMLTVLFSMLAAIGGLVLRKRAVAPLSKADRAFLQFCQVLARQKLDRHVGEGPNDYCRRISEARPDLASAAQRVTDAYVRQNYIGGEVNDVRELRSAVRAFRLRSLAAG